MTKILKIIIALITAMAIVGFIAVISKGLNDAEKIECNTWKEEAKRMPAWNAENETGYYILPWQKTQCERHGIIINAYLLDDTK